MFCFTVRVHSTCLASLTFQSAVRMLELAAELNKATPELMWVAAVGLNSQWTDRVVGFCDK